MLKTIFSEDENQQDSGVKRHFKQARKIRSKQARKTGFSEEGIVDILFELQSPTDIDTQSGGRMAAELLSIIRKRDHLKMAEMLNKAIHMAVSFGPRFLGRSSLALNVCISDACNILQERSSDSALSFHEGDSLEEKKTQLKKICHAVNKNLEEKKRIWTESSYFFQDPIPQKGITRLAIKEKSLKELNLLLASTKIGTPFLVNNIKVFPLERECRKRSVLFVNEIKPGSKNMGDLPIVAIPGTVILKSPQNKMVSEHIEFGKFRNEPKDYWSLGKRLDSITCVDGNETNSNFSGQVAPYMGNLNYEGEELHGAHTRNRKPETVANVTKKLSQKECCGFVMQNSSGVIGLEIFNNPNDFKALAAPFAEFLCGPYNFCKFRGESINFSVGKKDLVIPWSWRKKGSIDHEKTNRRNSWVDGFREEHGLKNLSEIRRRSESERTGVQQVQALHTNGLLTHAKVSFSGRNARSRRFTSSQRQRVAPRFSRGSPWR